MMRLLLLFSLLATAGWGLSAQVVERRIDAQGGALTLPGIQVLIPPVPWFLRFDSASSAFRLYPLLRPKTRFILSKRCPNVR